MVGGRRCGKSTTLAAMWKNVNSVLGDTRLTLVPKNVEMFKAFSNKIDEINFKYFLDFDPFEKVPINTEGTDSISRYEFELGLMGSSEKLDLEFIDIPGEWYESDRGTTDSAERQRREDLMKEYIQTSDVYIIAIDTPCLMENLKTHNGYGEYHNKANKAIEITESLKDIEVSTYQSKDFIFVPLKCERYYFENKMPQVVECVKNGYYDLLSFLSSEKLKKDCTVSIMPIISLGGIEFQEFNGPMESPDESANYIYTNGIDSKLAPEFCEQPLIAAIEFLITKSMAYEPKQKAHSLMEWIKNILKRINFKSKSGTTFDLSEDFTYEIKKLHNKKITDESKGFVTVQKGNFGL